jgi:predicted TIM-barrel fold metal-dependent hydrolase
MRIVTLEEHVSFPGITDQIPNEIAAEHGQISGIMQQVTRKLGDVTGERLQSMDAAGVSTQVLSVSGLGADILSPKDGPDFSRKYNDLLAEKISNHKGRFAAFAHLPTTAPAEAAKELERTVKEHNFVGALINGMTKDKFLDDQEFAPILEKAQELDLPIYLHPGLPPKAVADIYYSNLPKQAGMILSIAGWGWHSETALHILRLIASGTLDKYPRLKLIIGHMGEMLPVMMARCDNTLRVGGAGVNQRSVSRTLREQVHITTSGIFTQPPLVAAIDTFGIDNILFSVDYPFSENQQAIDFLNNIKLPAAQVEQIAHGNADRLLKLS